MSCVLSETDFHSFYYRTYFFLQLYLPNYGKTYCFDTVFNEDASQTSVYAVSAQPAMRSFVNGTSAAILAYGQTGAGKTFTMGTDCTRGDLVG